jgi:hypothetical protein
MPRRVRLGTAFAQVRCDHGPEMIDPAPNRLIRDQNPPLRQQIFDVAKAQSEPKIEPDRPLNDFRRKAISVIADFLHRSGYRAARSIAIPKRCDNATAAKEYPAGSIGAAWQDWIKSLEWRALADSTRTKIWWPVWLKRIEPVFGDCAPDSVTMDLLSEWRARIEQTAGPDAAHKAMKVWRAFWWVMQAQRYTQLSDPSAKVRNRQPPPRTARCSHGEAMRRAKGAWRLGFKGLACIIVVCWDAGFSPKDARTLTAKHVAADPRTGRIVFDKSAEGRAKTGVAVIGTLSKFGDWLVRRCLAELGVEHAPDSILFRMRGGSPYGESRLGAENAAVRQASAPGDLRQLRDMRRSVLEAFAGGGYARNVAEKFGNSIDRSSFLFKTYNPVDLEKVRQTDASRLEGRRRRNQS